MLVVLLVLSCVVLYSVLFCCVGVVLFWCWWRCLDVLVLSRVVLPLVLVVLSCWCCVALCCAATGGVGVEKVSENNQRNTASQTTGYRREVK